MFRRVAVSFKRPQQVIARENRQFFNLLDLVPTSSLLRSSFFFSVLADPFASKQSKMLEVSMIGVTTLFILVWCTLIDDFAALPPGFGNHFFSRSLDERARQFETHFSMSKKLSIFGLNREHRTRLMTCETQKKNLKLWRNNKLHSIDMLYGWWNYFVILLEDHLLWNIIRSLMIMMKTIINKLKRILSRKKKHDISRWNLQIFRALNLCGWYAEGREQKMAEWMIGVALQVGPHTHTHTETALFLHVDTVEVALIKVGKGTDPRDPTFPMAFKTNRKDHQPARASKEKKNTNIKSFEASIFRLNWYLLYIPFEILYSS